MTIAAPPVVMTLERQLLLDRPLFIVGAPRSGTSWVQRLLLSHPDTCGSQESSFFLHLSSLINTARPAREGARAIGMKCYWTSDDLLEELRNLWRKTFNIVAESAPGARLLIEKTPSHARHINSIVHLLPEARFIHVIRDSRAVVASVLDAASSEWGKSWAPTTLEDAIGLWFLHVRDATEHGRPLGPDRYMEIHYEDISQSPEAELARLYQFAGIEADDQLIRSVVGEQQFDRQQQTGGSVIPVFGENRSMRHAATEPVGFFNSGRLDAWKQKLSLVQQLKIWRRTRHQMRSLGYDYRGMRRRTDAK